MAEPGTAQLRKDSSVPPTRFAGVRGGPATPAAFPMPRGDLTAAAAEQIQQVVRDVWPGGPDAVRRRARGARFLLEYLAGFPGSVWQQRWEVSGLNERGRPVTAVRGKQAERDEICVGTACCPVSIEVARTAPVGATAHQPGAYLTEVGTGPLVPGKDWATGSGPTGPASAIGS